MQDTFGREITYMRISVTEACNMACRYCSPGGADGKEGRRQLLSTDQIVDVCRAAISLGIRNFRFTGGEPLLRQDLQEIVRRVHEIPGVGELTLTTNGLLLEGWIEDLVKSGLTGVNISLDTLDRKHFQEITGVDGLEQVMAGIRKALVFHGLRIHLNCVPQKGTTEDDLLQLAELSLRYPLSVRFIEMMPLGCGKKYRPVSNEKVKNLLYRRWPDLTPEEKSMERAGRRANFSVDGNAGAVEEMPSKTSGIRASHGLGPAVYYRIPGAAGTIGFISPISDRYCTACNRIRLTSDGHVKGCLSYASDLSVLPAFQIADREERQAALVEVLKQGILLKPQAHTFAERAGASEDRTMQEIGG